ncbi:hypothetical protein ACFTUC_17330 [Streptomyces sp. NPDC056944]|uniref:hypothetical protein n=1 Tax=Streptomyces sp. NPDC056944 TaxID=3345972 RepID=UPI00362E67C9
MSDPFWDAIRTQLKELEQAKCADDVIRILSPERNPYGSDWDGMDGAAEGFFAGSGGDGRVNEALEEAGWSYVWARATYWWAMQAPDGSVITYIEGDIYRGDRR